MSKYTDAEKCKKFDDLFRMAKKNFDYMREHGYEDGEYYIYEEVMRLLGGQEMWDAYNEYHL